MNADTGANESNDGVVGTHKRDGSVGRPRHQQQRHREEGATTNRRGRDFEISSLRFPSPSFLLTVPGLALTLAFLSYNAIILAALLFSIRANIPVEGCKGVGFLLSVTIAGYSALLYHLVIKKIRCGIERGSRWGRLIAKAKDAADNRKFRKYLPWLVMSALLVSALIFACVDSGGDRKRILPFFALILVVLLSVLASERPRSVNWRIPAACFTFNFLLLVCWSRISAFRHSLSCMLMAKTRAMAMATGQMAAQAAFGPLGLARGWDDEEKARTSGLNDSVVVRSSAVSSSPTDWLSWRPPAASGREGSEIPLAFLCLHFLVGVYAVGALAAAIRYLGVTGWAVRSVGGTMKDVFGASQTECVYALLLSIGLGPHEAAVILWSELLALASTVYPGQVCAVLVMGAVSRGGILANSVYVDVFGLDENLLDVTAVASVFSVLAVSKMVMPDGKGRKSGASKLPFTKAKSGGARENKSDPVPVGEGAESMLEAILSSVQASSEVLLSCVGLCLVSGVATMALDLATRSVGAFFLLEALTPASLVGVALRPAAFLVGVDWHESGKVSQVLASRLFYSGPAAVSRLVGYSAHGVDQLSVRAVDLAVASGVTDGGLIPAGSLALSVGAVSALLTAPKCADLIRGRVWRIVASLLGGALATGATAGMVLK